MSDLQTSGEKSRERRRKLILVGLGVLLLVIVGVLLPSLMFGSARPVSPAYTRTLEAPTGTPTEEPAYPANTESPAEGPGTESPASAPVFVIVDTCESLFQGENFSFIEYELARAGVYGFFTLDLSDSTIYLIVEDMHGQLWVSDRANLIDNEWAAFAFLKAGEPATIFAIAGDASLIEPRIHDSILDPAVFEYIDPAYITNHIGCNVPSFEEVLGQEPVATEISKGAKPSEANPVGEVLVTYPERLSPSSTDLVTLSIYLPIPSELMPLIEANVEPVDVSIVELPLDAGLGAVVGRNRNYQGTIQVSPVMWARFESINISARARQEDEYQEINLDASGVRTTWLWDILAPGILGRQNFSILVGGLGSEDPIWRGDFELEIVQLTPVPTNTSLPTETFTNTPSPTNTPTDTPSSTPTPTFTPTPQIGFAGNNGTTLICVVLLLGLVILAISYRRIIAWLREPPGKQTPPSSRQKSSLRIFISYRRADSIDITGRIYDRLVEKFGRDSIFKDVDSIPLGLDFKAYLDEQVGEYHVLLAIIGGHWLDAGDASGNRRLDDPADYVRIEIESALEKDIPVIPLLVSGAQMPSEESLPSSLRKLAYRNGIPIRPDPDFHRDMDRLISALEKYVK